MKYSRQAIGLAFCLVSWTSVAEAPIPTPVIPKEVEAPKPKPQSRYFMTTECVKKKCRMVARPFKLSEKDPNVWVRDKERDKIIKQIGERMKKSQSQK